MRSVVPAPLREAVHSAEKDAAREQRARGASIDPLDELGRALGPPLLPIVGIAVAGMLLLGFEWKVAGIVLLVAAGSLLVAREGRNIRAFTDAVTAAGFWIPSVLLVVLAVVLRLVGQYGTLARAVVLVGFVAWAVAIVCRLLGFATARTRAAFVAAALVTALVAFLSLFVWDGVPAALVAVPAFLAFAALVVVVLNEHGREPGPGRLGFDNPGRPGATLLMVQQWGLSWAGVATLAFLVATGFSVLSGPPPTAKQDRLQFVSGGDVEASIAGLDGEELARRFSPVLQFSESQRWEPVPVDGFVEAASLHWTNGMQVRAKGDVTMEDLERTCPRGVGTPCYELRIDCSATASDESGNDCERGATMPKGLHRGGHSYVRVLDWRDRAGYPRRPGRPAPFGAEIQTLVQYWFFYYYDDWRAQTLYGRLRQSHEGDWEAVTIGFGRDRPLFVAFSSHCGGTWRDWDDVRLAKPNALIRGETHPVAGVSEGSMAMYAEPDETRAPNWAPCAGIPAAEASAASFAYNVRDQTGEWRALALPDESLVPVTEDHPVMGFPGHWGTNGSATFTTTLGKTYELERGGRGPKSPPYQELWAEPLGRIFCTKTWEYDGDREFEDCREARST